MIDTNGRRVYLYPGYTDFRLGIHGLSLLVSSPEENVIYVFCGKSKRSLKMM